MKKLLFIFVFSSPAWAVNVPEFTHKDPIVQREFENVGNEIKKARSRADDVGISTVNAGYGLSGGGSSSNVTLNLKADVTDYIQNKNTLQTGATFYVSSGTVSQFTATAATMTTLNVVRISTFGTNGGVPIRATATNNSATSGDYGECISTVAANLSNFPTTTQYGDIVTLSLTPGDWVISLFAYYDNNGATNSEARFGIGTGAGNDGGNLVLGDTFWFHSEAAIPDGTLSPSIPMWETKIAVPTNYYLKFRGNYSGGPPKARGRLIGCRPR